MSMSSSPSIVSDLPTSQFSNPDSLSITSRAFFERSYFKMFLSIVYSAFSLFCLALCSQTSGLSKNADELSKVSTATDDNKDYTDGYYALSSGYGFAAFFFFAAFVLALAAACHISPIISGSKNEAQTLKNPMELSTTN